MGAFLNGERLAGSQAGPLRRLTGSRRINAELAEKYAGQYEVVDFVPSLACRLVMVANGEIDAAFARPGAHVWDVAAAGLVLAESGAGLVMQSGEPWAIASRSIRAPALIAASSANLSAALVLAKSSRILQ
jgi:myo-inositol-1(or 4)-monophosphatase